MSQQSRPTMSMVVVKVTVVVIMVTVVVMVPLVPLVVVLEIHYMQKPLAVSIFPTLRK